MTGDQILSVALVLHPTNRGWILEKFADRLASHLEAWGVTATITDAISPAADLHHFMMYMHGPSARIGPSTALITHVDRPHKVYELRQLMQHIDVGICLSRMTVQQLVDFGLPTQKLCFVVPGCDSIAEPRRTILLIATRLYRDMRKREDLLVQLAAAMPLHNFRFEIFGLGWERVSATLTDAGAQVVRAEPTGDYVADHQRILEGLTRADYYFYPGLDEGSMGLMDALAAGVPTISTPQGFHLDIPFGLTHAFESFPEMLAIFQQLARERQQRLESIEQFSWNEYARRHAVIWRSVLTNDGSANFRTLFDDAGLPPPAMPSRRDIARRWSDLLLDEMKRVGRYAWKRARRDTQPSDARRR